jgi:hypothetical protein
MTQVDDAEVLRGKRAFLRAQIQQAHLLLNPSQRSAQPPCSEAGVGGWWALRVKENFVAAIWKLELPPLYFLGQAEEIAPELEVIARNVEKGRA